MTKPKAIVFDLGKVLVDFDYTIASRRIADRSEVGAGEVQELICGSALHERFETGRLTSMEFFEAVRAATRFSGTMVEFMQFFADIFTPIESMIRLHTAIRQQRIPTFIFSNTNALAIEHIRNRFPFFGGFNGYVFSYEEGAMKPDPAIYDVVERRTDLRGQDILYLDDRPENIASGASRDWQVILQEDAERTWIQMRRLGILA